MITQETLSGVSFEITLPADFTLRTVSSDVVENTQVEMIVWEQPDTAAGPIFEISITNNIDNLHESELFEQANRSYAALYNAGRAEEQYINGLRFATAVFLNEPMPGFRVHGKFFLTVVKNKLIVMTAAAPPGVADVGAMMEETALSFTALSIDGAPIQSEYHSKSN